MWDMIVSPIDVFTTGCTAGIVARWLGQEHKRSFRMPSFPHFSLCACNFLEDVTKMQLPCLIATRRSIRWDHTQLQSHGNDSWACVYPERIGRFQQVKGQKSAPLLYNNNCVFQRITAFVFAKRVVTVASEQAQSQKSNPGVLPILRTKLYIPQPRPNIIPRTHLYHRIDEAIQSNHHLILVSAPAGFGKSTLLGHWASESAFPVVWYSLDEGDNDRTRFLTYLITSLQRLDPEIGKSAFSLVQSPQSPPIEEILTSLLNDLVDYKGRIPIILDDYHLIILPEVHDVIEYLLEHVPASVHLIIATRSDPPFAMARMRSRNLLTELTEFDLRFREDETTTYLNHIMGLGLTEEQVEALEQQTEGWIAGLQMVALSMQSHESASQFIQSLSGTHRHILDYLVEEVLAHQDPFIREFLLKTSILDQLCGPLCEHVLGTDFLSREGESGVKANLSPLSSGSGQSLLQQLDMQNLFIVPLDDERRWYRYHRLFSELLQTLLVKEYPELVPELHFRASQWFEQNSLLNDAVRHALTSGNHTHAAQLIGQHALALVYQGNLSTLALWLDALPVAVKQNHPWLNIAHAWALTFAGQLDQVAVLIRAAEESLDTVKDRVDRQRLSGIIDALRAYLLALRGSMPLAAEFAREALKFLPDDDVKLRGFSAMLLATVLRWNGDFNAAIEAYEDAIAINQSARDFTVLVESLCDLAELEALQGKLDRSMETCKRAMDVGTQYLASFGARLPSYGYAHIRMSAIFRERNDLQQARVFAHDGLAILEDWGQADLLLRVYLELARVLQACGEGKDALRALQDTLPLARDLSPWHLARVNALLATISLQQGDRQQASYFAGQLDEMLDGALEFQNLEIYLALARIKLAALQVDTKDKNLKRDLLSLLGSLKEMVERSGADAYLIEIQLLNALTHQTMGNIEQALHPLKQALELGQMHGFQRIFLDECETLVPLLQELRQQDSSLKGDYLDRLIFACQQTDVDRALLVQHPSGLVIESLSEREIEVLRYLSTHLTSNEIADNLYIAASTVRSHIKNIYTKLGVHSRKEAVTRAQELDLI